MDDQERLFRGFFNTLLERVRDDVREGYQFGTPEDVIEDAVVERLNAIASRLVSETE